ncbi:uncharacterized protein LOC110440494 isoform X2 [Mizuhopecten yessoensis]|uniref:uncharacterized protein LOC110440494 isoform X2 n=1 Tax=Mizuhopecten yessoensis TaxID=6573 RepID=UPI000B45811B|nr:uncharacterized protein LOC110440494 isoform X2 [Mizuhopecten yessoensis]
MKKGKKSKASTAMKPVDSDDSGSGPVMKPRSLPNQAFGNMSNPKGIPGMNKLLEKASKDNEKLTEEYAAGSMTTKARTPSPKTTVIDKAKMLKLFEEEKITTHFPLEKIQGIMAMVTAGGAFTLDFSGIEQVCDAVFATMVMNKAVKSVKVIKLNGCCHVTDLGVMWMASCFPELVEVSLSGCVLVTESGLHALVTKCKKLTDLDLTGTNVSILVSGCADKNIVINGCPVISPDKKTMANQDLSSILKAPGFMKSDKTDMVKVIVSKPLNSTSSFVAYLTKDSIKEAKMFRIKMAHSLAPGFTANMLECDMGVMDHFITKRSLCVLPYGADADMSADAIATRLYAVVSHALSVDSGIPFIIAGMSNGGKKCVSPDAVKTAMDKLISKSKDSLKAETQMCQKPQLKDCHWIEQQQLCRALNLLSGLENIKISTLTLDLNAAGQADVNAKLMGGVKQVSAAYPEYQEMYAAVFSYITSDAIDTMLKDGIVSIKSSAKSNQRVLTIMEYFGRAKCLQLSNQDTAMASIQCMADIISTAFDGNHGNNDGSTSLVSNGVPLYVREEMKKTLTKVFKGDEEQGANGVTLYSELGLSCAVSATANVLLNQLTDTVPAAVNLIRKTDRKDIIYAEYTFEFSHPVSNGLLHRIINMAALIRKPLFIWQTGCVQQEGLVEVILEMQHNGAVSKLRVKSQTPQENSLFPAKTKITVDRANMRIWQLLEQYSQLALKVIKQMGLFAKIERKSTDPKPSNVFACISDHKIPVPTEVEEKMTSQSLLCSICGISTNHYELQTRVQRKITTSFLASSQMMFPPDTDKVTQSGNLLSFLPGSESSHVLFKTIMDPYEQNSWKITFLEGKPSNISISLLLGGEGEMFYNLDLNAKEFVAGNGTEKKVLMKVPPVELGDTLVLQLSPGPVLQGKPEYSFSLIIQEQLIMTFSVPAKKIKVRITGRHVADSTSTVMVHGLLPVPSKSTEVVEGMRLEALDRLNPSLVCVASVGKIDETDGRLLIHFDGWTKRYDYWTEPESKDIHPIGYMALNANSSNHNYTVELQRPKGRAQEFEWFDYLQEIGQLPVPYEFFNEAQCEGTQPDVENEVLTKLGYASDVSNQQVMSCVSAKDTERRLEFATMKKCTLTPAVVDFFNNKFKFFCLLPANLNEDMLMYPSLQQIINQADQMIHLLCPGNRMELLHFLDHPGLSLATYNKDTQFQQIASYLSNCYIGLLIQKDILPNPPMKMIGGIEGTLTPDTLDLMETRLRRIFYLYLLWIGQVELLNKELGMTVDIHMTILTNIQGNKAACSELNKVFDLSHGFKTTGINSCLAHSLALSAGQDMKTISMDRFQMMYQFLQKLDFRKNGLKELSNDFLGRFTKLEELDLSENQLQVLPKGFSNTIWLSHLNISKNQISQLPDDLSALKDVLTFLDISDNPFKEIPKVVWTLVSLKTLHADNIGKIGNLEAIVNMKDLTELSLASNLITTIPESFGQLALTYLNLSGIPWFPDLVTGKSRPTFKTFKSILNQYTVFGAMLDEKEQFELFSKVDKDASGTLEKEELLEMNTLLFSMYPRFGVKDLAYPATGGVPGVICKLTSLERLELSFHGLKQVPDEIKNLKALTSLDVSNNPYLESISSSVGELPMKEINLKYCPTLKTPPKEVVARGFNAVFGYLKRLLSGSVQCRRTKLMMVGLGGAGKTSLVRSLTASRAVYNQDYGEQITDGISITDWTVDTKNKDESLTFNVWDFAGQTVYYNTHQFFLSNRAVYLLLWNIRLGFEHAGLDFWLNSVVCHAPKAPIIIVGTHCDKVEKSKIPQDELKRKYPQIAGFFFVSSFTGEGIQDLKTFLVNLTLQQKYMGERIPEAWLTLEQRVIQKRKEEKIDLMKWKGVEDVASHCGIVDGQELVQAVHFLHDLGSLQFFNTEFLRGYVVIYPQWIVDVMACIVTVHAGPTQDGKLFHKDMAEIWKAYPEEFHPWLLRLTEEFDLTFPLVDEPANLVPCLLPNTEQKYNWPVIEEGSNIKEGKMIYSFEYLPAGLFNRAQVRLHQFAENGILWKKGMFLKKNDHIAVVLQDSAGSVLVKAQGFRPENIIFLVHEVFETLITDAYSGVQYDFRIPCMECMNMHLSEPSMFSATKIHRAAELKAPFLQCDNLFHVLSISELQNALPPDRNVDLDNHLRRSVQELQDLGEGVKVNMLFCYSKRNIPSLQDEGKCVHPGTIMEDLRAAGYNVAFCDNPETADMSALTLTMKSAKVVLIGMSDELCETEACRNIIIFVKETLRKPIVLVALGKGLKWKDSNIYITLNDEVYIKMTDPKLYQNKFAELKEAIQRKVLKKAVVEDQPACFVSYCWSNSHDAISKGSRKKEGALGYGDPRKVKNYLESKGIPCWLDIERVGGGGLFEDIAGGLRKAQVVVACVSNEYANSNNCQMEFRFALCQLRLPIILAVVGTGYQWERSEIGMLAVGHQSVKVNFQHETGDAFDALLKEVKAKIKVNTDEDESKNGKDQQKVAFQEVLELSQRQFLRHLVGYADSMYSGHYPRLIVLDLVEEEIQPAEEKKVEVVMTDEERKAAEAENKAKHAETLNAKMKQALKNIKDKDGKEKSEAEKKEEEEEDEEEEEEEENTKWKSKYCYRLLCEHEEGWHTVDLTIPSPEHEGKEEEEQWLASMAPYMARMFAILKYSSLNMASLNTPEGQTLQAKLQTIATDLNKNEFQDEYVEVRASVMDIDKQKTAAGLKRCHMLNGKTLWLCDKHRGQSGSKTEKLYQQLLMPHEDPGKAKHSKPEEIAVLAQQEPESTPSQATSRREPKEPSKPKLFRMRETGGSKSGKLKRQTSQACSVM